MARRLLGAEPDKRAILVSLGAKGAVLVDAGRPRKIPAPRVRAVDTVGAGDALNGALAAGLAAGLHLDAAARRAVVAAALSVTRAGARDGMPTAEELERALARSVGSRRQPIAPAQTEKT